MNGKRYRPLIDWTFWMILIPTMLLLIAATVFAALEPTALFIILPVDLFSLYFLVSPLFGYVELREGSLFIKYGLMLKKEIPYEKIRKVERDKRFYSESMTSLKLSLDHVNVKYNSFDVTTVSVRDNESFMKDLNGLIK